MLPDKKAKFSTDQAITVTAVSSDQVDLGPQHNGESLGASIALMIAVSEAFAAAGAATLQIQVQSDNDIAFGSARDEVYSPFISKDDLILGSRHFRIDLPKKIQRYVRLNYLVTTGPFTAGKLKAGLVLHDHTNE